MGWFLWKIWLDYVILLEALVRMRCRFIGHLLDTLHLSCVSLSSSMHPFGFFIFVCRIPVLLGPEFPILIELPWKLSVSNPSKWGFCFNEHIIIPLFHLCSASEVYFFTHPLFSQVLHYCTTNMSSSLLELGCIGYPSKSPLFALAKYNLTIWV